MFVLPPDRPAVMGVLNVTPDSFSDGGAYPSVSAAVDRARQMVDEGADLVDIGGESTRPGSSPVSEEEELQRVLPVVEAVAARGIPVSVDTMKAAVARPALSAGAVVVNDVSAMRDPAMAEVVAGARATICLVHMQGAPATMQNEPHYDAVVAEVRAFLVATAGRAERAGIARDRIWIDPGIGFGKTDSHNYALLAHVRELAATGYPVLIGISRKGFLGRLLNGAETGERMNAALAIQALVQAAGARILRTHDVRPTREAVAATAAVLSG